MKNTQTIIDSKKKIAREIPILSPINPDVTAETGLSHTLPMPIITAMLVLIANALSANGTKLMVPQ